jgi:beta-glucosidase
MRVSSSLLALSTLLLQSAVAQDAAERAALSLFWDYGRSPPVYPSPQGAGTGDWASAYSQARAIVAQMTNLEKQNVTIGFAATEHPCSGNSPGVDRLGYPGMCLQDAGNGVRGTEGVSGFPAGIHLGASWNKKLAFDRASAMGAEFKTKGGEYLLHSVCADISLIRLTDHSQCCTWPRRWTSR